MQRKTASCHTPKLASVLHNKGTGTTMNGYVNVDYEHDPAFATYQPAPRAPYYPAFDQPSPAKATTIAPTSSNPYEHVPLDTTSHLSSDSGSTVEHVVNALTMGRRNASGSHAFHCRPLKPIEKAFYSSPYAVAQLTKAQRKTLASSALAGIM